MARKTAMGKEPGNVSIALPQSEKDRLAGKKPVVSPPVKEQLKRMSPGVYRNSQGKLVGSKGQGLPKASPIQNALQNAPIRPDSRPGQPIPQQEIDAANESIRLVNETMNQYPMPKSPMENWQGGNSQLPQMPNMGNQQMVPYPSQNQSGYLPAQPWQQQPVQDLMYRYPAGTTPPDMRLFAPYRPMNLAPQPQQAQQPQTVSGLLQRNR